MGPLEVVEDGRPVPLGGRRQRALLGLLLVNANEMLSTDRLIDELWGDQPPAGAAKAVQVTVSRLRKALGTGDGEANGVVLTHGRGYELRVDRERVDAQRFERLLGSGRSELAAGRPEAAAADLEAALSLWRGPALDELSGLAFAHHEAGRLEELRLEAEGELIEAKLALGRHREVVGRLEQLIGQHPYRERLRGQLMLALYRSDRQAEALQAYQDARRTLVEELGIEPSERLRELERAVLAQDPALVLHREVLPPAVVRQADGVSFVGRARELEALTSDLEQALRGRGGACLVAGEPGIGKTRLADEVIGRARERGARVLVGRCWEAGGAPAYWPWVQALRAYVREADPDDLHSQLGSNAALLATILPELREMLSLAAPPALDSEGSRFRLLEAVAAFLGTIAASRPLALFLDDLHAADAPSLLLLRFVARDLAGVRVLIVGCYRDTEVGPDLGAALDDLAREPVVRRVALHGLRESDTARLLELTLGEGPAAELAAHVHEETQGNPLFATEIGRLIESEVAAGQYRGELPIPARVSEAIGRRLERQSERCREVLTVASVAGREFDPEVIAATSGIGDDAVLRALEEAAEVQLVADVPDGRGRLRFSHILVRDTLYRGLPAPRRLRLHRATAEALERRYAADLDPHAAELAHHYLEAGTAVADKAVDFARRAGGRAAAQLAYEEAARHFTSALRVAESTGTGDLRGRCELLISLGEALSRSGRGEEAKRQLSSAAALAEEAGEPGLLARAAAEYGGRFAWARGSSDPALIPMLRRALAAVGPADSAERVRLLARLAAAYRDEPLRHNRERLGREAVEMAERIGDRATLAFAIEGWFIAVEGPDGTGRGIDLGAKLIAMGQEVGDKERVFAGHDHRIYTFWQLCDRAALDVEVDAVDALVAELRQPTHNWYAGTLQTMLALMEGRFEQAERIIADTVALGRQAESWNATVSERLALFVLRREQGRLAELEDTIRRSVHEYPALFRFQCALAHLYAELGGEGDARATLDALLARDLAHEHLDAEWTFSIALLAEPCAAVGDAEAIARVYSLLLPYERRYAQAPIEAVFGALARGLGVLATALGRFDDAERHFEDAIAIEREMRAPPWLAHAQHALAEMLLTRRGAGDAERAQALLGEAIEAYGKLGMDSWAARAKALEERQRAPLRGPRAGESASG